MLVSVFLHTGGAKKLIIHCTFCKATHLCFLPRSCGKRKGEVTVIIIRQVSQNVERVFRENTDVD